MNAEKCVLCHGSYHAYSLTRTYIHMRTSEQVTAGVLLSAIVNSILKNDLPDRLLFVIWLHLWTREKLLPFILAGICVVHATNGNGTKASVLLSFVDKYCTCAPSVVTLFNSVFSTIATKETRKMLLLPWLLHRWLQAVVVCGVHNVSE